jgi:hypothetical protein
VVVAQPVARAKVADLVPEKGALLKLNCVPLAVKKADSFDAIVPAQRPGQARCGILAGGEKNERAS